MTWCYIYTGYLSRLQADLGPILTSARGEQLTDMLDIQLRLSEIGAHSSLEIDERYHELLRQIYRKYNLANRK